ncbi:uncharacterized protein BDV14DRAFT_197011 [Aspergillus stella-maris]|uniref:uncharacterized protein n=1 Tax=Aspergillus stella-maris TaxID=1810926 RepID=UPI003CCD3A99
MPSFFGNSARRGGETGARSSVVSSSSSRRSLWEREVDPSDSASQVSAPRSSHRSHHSSRHSQASEYPASRSSRHSISSSRMSETSDRRTVTPSKYTSSRMSSSSRDPSRLSRPGDAPDLQRADFMRRGSSRVTSISGVPDMGSAGAIAPYRSGMYHIQEIPSTGYPSVVSSSTSASSRAPSSRTSGMSASRNGMALDSDWGSRGSVMTSSRRRCTCHRGYNACCAGSRDSAPVPFVGHSSGPEGTYVYAGYRID